MDNTFKSGIYIIMRFLVLSYFLSLPFSLPLYLSLSLVPTPKSYIVDITIPSVSPSPDATHTKKIMVTFQSQTNWNRNRFYLPKYTFLLLPWYGCDYDFAYSMVLMLDGNSEHVAHAWRKICLFGKKNGWFVTALASCIFFSVTI